MPTHKLYQVDAFATEIFKGNPAAVVPFEEWPSDQMLQSIAIENNLSETAFYKPNGNGFDLRWFTPGYEVDLCGHATLATAHVLFEHQAFTGEEIRFQSRVGELVVKRTADGYLMDFPIDRIQQHPAPDSVSKAFGCEILESFQGREDYLLIVENQATVETLQPDQAMLLKTRCRGFIVSAPGDKVDFVSRCFYPSAGIPEDPVTGSAHTTMAAYWSPIMGSKLRAKQLSARGGEIGVEVIGDRVHLTGSATTFMAGEIYL